VWFHLDTACRCAAALAHNDNRSPLRGCARL
jgi:hypothetical protein